MVPVVRAVGRKRAMELLLTGEAIDARTAADWGLVNRVVPADQLEDAVQELVAAVSRSSPLIVAIGKEAFYTQVDLGEHEAYEHMQGVMAQNALAADAQEGMGAFLEKRPPSWTGRSRERLEAIGEAPEPCRSDGARRAVTGQPLGGSLAL
jgi:enoyl-CoA hydratase/carnithine racemase